MSGKQDLIEGDVMAVIRYMLETRLNFNSRVSHFIKFCFEDTKRCVLCRENKRKITRRTCGVLPGPSPRAPVTWFER